MKRPRTRRLFRYTSRSAADIDRDLRDEFAFHVDMRAEALEREGMTPEVARTTAEREFGDRAGTTTSCAPHDREVEARRSLALLSEELTTDLRYSLRTARRAPGLAAVIIMTVAVAMAGNTAVFTIVNSLLFKPATLRDPSGLVRIHTGESRISAANLRDIIARATVFNAVIAQRAVAPAMETPAGTLYVTGAEVSANYFTTLEMAAARGRVFLPADTREDVIVISDRLWHLRFTNEPATVGRVVTLNGESKEIIGIMPPNFRGLAPPGLGRDFWTPVPRTTAPGADDRRERRYEAFARLAPGVALPQAQSAMAMVGTQLKNEHPADNARFDRTVLFGVTGFDAFRGIGSAALPIFAFVGVLALAAALVLLMACANIAGLLLGRAASRRRETAIRLALGAGRARLIQQLLTEGFVLALTGAAAGVLLSVWLTGLAQRATDSLPFPVDFDFSPDWRVLTYSAALACLTAVLFGLSPARRAARTDLVGALMNDEGGDTQRLRQKLVVAQVFACTVLLLWAALFTRSLGNVSAVDPGFRTDGVLVMDVSPPEQIAPSHASAHDLLERLQERVAGMPGVTASGMAWAVPLGFMAREEYDVRLSETAGQENRRVLSNTVSPGFFSSVGIPLLAGRDVSRSDTAGAPRVVLVNQTAARRFWNHEAVGRTIKMPDDDEWVDATVIGVVGDSKYWTLGEEIQPVVYPALSQRRSRGANLFVRSAHPTHTATALREELRRTLPGMPVDVRHFEDAIKVSLMPARVGAAATAAIGCTAMLLAAVGIYALVAFSVAQRSREIGIRRAVGATGSDIARLIVCGSLLRVATGLVPGLTIGALGAAGFAAFIVGVSPFDAATLAAIAVMILLVATIASARPAYRATRVDPLRVLRAEN